MNKSTDRTSAVAVLAGGRSRRMGGNEKALLPIGGITLLERVLLVALPLDLPTFVVCGQKPSAAIPAVLEQMRHDRVRQLSLVQDLYPDRGPLGGLLTAFSSSSVDWMLTLACDLPLLTTDLLAYILAETEARYDLVVPQDECGLQPLCAAYQKTCRPLLDKAVTDHRLSAVEFAHGLQRKVVDGATIRNHLDQGSRADAWFTNVNTLTDLDKAERYLRAVPSRQKT